ncbi:5-formyltetrahydrofolate cyclo-ligase [Tranquillimonas alkanivorans]|uniref:5-formyltetrahydrofolate cyclo-ligase n=1 Tax=Tranquillimonas alkanivorans TaxID=441119 RepID=A0A1I5V9K9_9RHOB|nr:5-formyltetrahydrofolate cyclo-ligase [Tranquillimonas alkanivorans]SFQ04179.1 5-formyltetrahydrofolate cyclo-ligase [Tranquillimonas alkanivorans]
MEEEPAGGGSEPCLGHLLVDGHPVDPQTVRDVARFRRAERARLLQARTRPVAEARKAADVLEDALAGLVAPAPGQRIAVYWPIRGEPDLRGWMREAHEAGARVLLPVVVRKDAPLAFRRWTPGCRMERGLWNIPVPAEGESEHPDTVIAPLVGVDEALFRLGNGGGYYDRTLVRLEPRPHVIGVGFAECRLRTIFPMPWDVPMNVVILSDGTRLQARGPV